jgi:hypothetical protein
MVADHDHYPAVPVRADRFDDGGEVGVGAAVPMEGFGTVRTEDVGRGVGLVELRHHQVGTGAQRLDDSGRGLPVLGVAEHVAGDTRFHLAGGPEEVGPSCPGHPDQVMVPEHGGGGPSGLMHGVEQRGDGRAPLPRRHRPVPHRQLVGHDPVDGRRDPGHEGGVVRVGRRRHDADPAAPAPTAGPGQPGQAGHHLVVDMTRAQPVEP